MKIDIEVAFTLPFLANRTKQRKLRLREMKTSRQKTIEGIFRRVHSAYAILLSPYRHRKTKQCPRRKFQVAIVNRRQRQSSFNFIIDLRNSIKIFVLPLEGQGAD